MAYFGLESVRAYQYRIIPTYELRTRDHMALDSLMEESLRHDYPDRLPSEVDYAVSRSRNMRVRLNAHIGEPGYPRKGQRYARAHTVVAFDKNDRPKAYLTVANNASSKMADPVQRMGVSPDKKLLISALETAGRAEIEAKLHLPLTRFTEHRYLWLGARALSREMNHEIDTTLPRPNHVNVMDVLGSLALNLPEIHQPLSTYPRDGETDWVASIIDWNFSHDSALPEPVNQFGETADPVSQTHYVGKQIRMFSGILNKVDGFEAIEEFGGRQYV